jgi:prepilin-type N-terminal cleavage/methylation domain-containing protein/prepilin-type processing-associated H-X9-DG protein
MRKGFTLIETLVVIMVISILIAMIMPAIQSSRAAARSLQCSNHLRQIGIALQNYEARMNGFPTRFRFSPQSMLLPDLELKPLLDQVNFTSFYFFETNETVLMTDVSIFLCPQDRSVDASDNQAWTSYQGNYGSGYPFYGDNGVFADKFVTLGQVSDGLSNTAAFSEISTGKMGLNKSGNSFKINGISVAKSDFEKFSLACDQANTQHSEFADFPLGSMWLRADLGSTLYNHVLPPNRPTCINNSGEFKNGAWTAGSRHQNKTNTIFADGHLQAIKTGINTQVWRAIGSRNGGEVVGSDF